MRGAAHQEHLVHVRDAGRDPVEWLVELPRALPRIASTGHTVRGELRAWEAGGGERAGEGTTADWGADWWLHRGRKGVHAH